MIDKIHATPPAVLRDIIDPARANALCATLGLAPLEPGVPLPPFFHQIYFWNIQPAETLGRDGVPTQGEGIPDFGLPRCLWAGGDLTFLSPLMSGTPAQKSTRVISSKRKSGRSGEMGFVTLQHDIQQSEVLCVRERKDLVYLEDPTRDGAPPNLRAAPTDEDSAEPMRFPETLLFRYSALTFNAHRIHYDMDYCRDVEGYGGLLVQGQLLAQLLMLKATRDCGPLARFKYRAVSPVLHRDQVELCRKGTTLWVRGPKGQLCMSATAKTA